MILSDAIDHAMALAKTGGDFVHHMRRLGWVRDNDFTAPPPAWRRFYGECPLLTSVGVESLKTTITYDGLQRPCPYQTGADPVIYIGSVKCGECEHFIGPEQTEYTVHDGHGQIMCKRKKGGTTK